MKKLLKPLLSIGTSFVLFLTGFSLVISNMNAVKVNAFDFSFDSNSTTLNPGELVELITGSSIDPLERDYLNNNHSEYTLTYQNNIENNEVEVVDYLNNLYVSIAPYSFKDKANRNLSWIPVSATYNNQTRSFTSEDDLYKCTFDNYDGINKNIDIQYSLNVTLPKNDVNTLINSAYNYALPSYNKLVSNNEYRDEYETSLEAYQNYVSALEEYEINKANYDNYLIEKNAYEINLSNYNAYLEAYARYEEELAIYNQYLEDLATYNAQVKAYNNYLEALEYYQNNYEANKELYDAYLVSKVKIDYRLQAMQILFERMSEYNRTIYDAVMGDSVTNVLSRRDDIVSVGGVPAEAVDRASVATSELREIFRSYNALTTDSERYSYYRLNWSHLRDNINDLARCLNKFLHYDIVFNLLAAQENNRLEKYIILVAQLIYFADAINVSPVYNYEGWNSSTNTGSLKPKDAAYLDSEYKIKVSQKESKTYKQILSDVTFMDTSLKYGRPGPEKYDEELIEQMTEPTPVEAPGEAPARVKEPIEPTKVNNPGNAPTPVANPGNRPETVENPLEPEYISLTEEETLLANAVFENRIVLRETYTDDVEISIPNNQTINFSNNLKHMVKLYDEEGNYIKDKVLTLGLTISNSEVYNNNYDKIYSSYSFNWTDSSGNLVDLSTLSTSGDLYAVLVPGEYKNYTVTFNIAGTLVNQNYHYGDTVLPPGEVNKAETEDLYFEFIGWDKQITKVEANVTYTAMFNTYHYIFINKVVDGVSTSYKFKEDEVNTNFETPTKPETDDNYYEFDKWNVTNTDAYHFTYEAVFRTYDFIYITWVIDENTQVSSGKYRQTDTITYPYSTPTKDGDETYTTYVMDYWMDENGTRVELNSITASITLYAHFIGTNEALYTVYFYLDNVIIYSNTYPKGATPVAPSVSKEGTEEYYYYFLGWDKPISPLTGNVTYNAVFELRYYLYVTVIVNGVSTNQKVMTLDDLVLNNPTKPASNGYTYAFKEWDVTQIDDTHYTYEAVFDAFFKVTFINGAEVDVVTYKVGGQITYKTPTKAQNNVYYYVFTNWRDVNGNIVDISTLTASITLYAEFEAKYVEYTVTWNLGNSTLVNVYHYGDVIVVPTDVAKNDTETSYFIFSGWNIKVPETVTGNITINATFAEHFYTLVTVDVEGETELFKFKEDEEIVLDTPTKEGDERHDYVFSKWEITKTGTHSYTYKATFNTITYVFVTWKSEGQVLEVEKYRINSYVSYKGETPTKDEEETVYYQFSGWDADLRYLVVKNDTTINATFKTLNKIAVVWITHFETVTEYYKEGEFLALPNIDLKSYHDDVYLYNFDGWDRPTEGIKVRSTLLITARYFKFTLVRYDGYSQTVYFGEDYVTLNFDKSIINDVDIRYLLETIYLEDEIKPIKINTYNATIIINASRVQYLKLNSINKLNFEAKMGANDVYEMRLDLTSASQDLLSAGAIDFDVKITGKFDPERSFLYIDGKISEGAFENDNLSIPSFKNGMDYRVITTYNIDIEYNPGCEITVDKTGAQKDEKVTVTYSLNPGYKLIKLIVETKNGEKFEIYDSFKMPASDIKISAEVEKIRYHITFVVDGRIVGETYGYYGDIVLDPGLKDPTIYEKPNDENYRYVFVGWDHEITSITGDQVYTAVFEAIELVHNTIEKKQSIAVILLIAGGSTLVIGAGVAITFILIKRKKK